MGRSSGLGPYDVAALPQRTPTDNFIARRRPAAMPYDVTIITVKPNTHSKALPPLEQWLKTNPRKGEFLACLTCEIGDLNQILLLHHYTSEADLAADRDALAKRSEEHTSELQSPDHLVCRLLLEKKTKTKYH